MKTFRALLLPLAFCVFAMSQTCGAQWSLRPIIVTHDILPRTSDAATPEGLQNVLIAGDTVYFKDDHGIFLSTPDTLIGLVTELDTIPGTEDLFDSFADYGGLPKPGMWTTALGLAGSTALTIHDLLRPGIGPTAVFGGGGGPVWGGALQWAFGGGTVGGFRIVAPGKIGFTYAVEGSLTFFVAQAGRITRLGSLPDTYDVNGSEYRFASGDGLGGWLMEDTPSGTVVYFVWNDYVRGFVGDDLYSGFFAFDGSAVTKLLAKADRLGAGDSLRIGSITGRLNGPLLVRDRDGDRWMVQAVYGLRRKTGEWKVANGILLMERGRVTSIVQAGDSLARSGGALPSHDDLYRKDYSGNPIYSLSWQPDFSRRGVILFGDYLAPDKTQALLLAHDGIVGPLSPWGIGSELPGVGGGRVEGFTVVQKRRGQSSLTISQHLVSLDSLWVTSLVAIAGSTDDVTHGIFRCEGSTIHRLVVQRDSIAKGGARLVHGLGRFEYCGSTDVLVAVADVDNTGRDRALLCVEGGRSAEITSTVGGGVFDRRRPGKAKPVNFSSLGQFKVVGRNKIVFFAGNPVVSGWFLAERTP